MFQVLPCLICLHSTVTINCVRLGTIFYFIIMLPRNLVAFSRATLCKISYRKSTTQQRFSLQYDKYGTDVKRGFKLTLKAVPLI